MEFTKTKLLILDDDSSYLHLIKLIMEDIGLLHLNLVSNYQEAIEAYQDFQPDACFLDIELNHMQKNGIDVAQAIRKQNRNIPIVFLTSHFQDDYYDKVRSIRPISFMNKELSRLKVRQVIDLVHLQLENTQLKKRFSSSKGDASPALPNIPSLCNSNYFFKIGDTYKSINLAEIDFFFSENKLTYARVGNRNYPTNVQLKVLEKALDSKFLRAHKKFLINVDSIDSIIIKDSKIKIKEELLAIGYAYRKSFLSRLNLLK